MAQLTKTLGSVDFDRRRGEKEIVQGDVSRWSHLVSGLCSGTTSPKFLNNLKLLLQRVNGDMQDTKANYQVIKQLYIFF